MLEGFFNPISILLHMLNTAILGFAIYKFLYNPISVNIAKREAMIADMVDGAAKASEEAREKTSKADKALEEADKKAASIIAESSRLAQARAVTIADKAQKDAQETRDRAFGESRKFIIEAQEHVRDQAADLAVTMAEKIIERNFSKEDHDKFIKEMIEGLG